MSGVCAPIVPTSRNLLTPPSTRKAASHAACPLVGAPGLEPGTSSPPDWRANQAAPRPVAHRV
jgi:hypothetical protein